MWPSAVPDVVFSCLSLISTPQNDVVSKIMPFKSLYSLALVLPSVFTDGEKSLSFHEFSSFTYYLLSTGQGLSSQL